MRRRDFLAGTAVVLASGTETRASAAALGTALAISEREGALTKQNGDTPVHGASWYSAANEGDALVYRFKPGALASTKYLTTDMLLDGDTLIVFNILLHEGENGRTFRFMF